MPFFREASQKGRQERSPRQEQCHQNAWGQGEGAGRLSNRESITQMLSNDPGIQGCMKIPEMKNLSQRTERQQENQERPQITNQADSVRTPSEGNQGDADRYHPPVSQKSTPRSSPQGSPERKLQVLQILESKQAERNEQQNQRSFQGPHCHPDQRSST
jgi:hypothetical protein